LKIFLSRIGLFKDCKELLLNLKTKEEGECLSFAHAHRDGEELLDTKKYGLTKYPQYFLLSLVESVESLGL